MEYTLCAIIIHDKILLKHSTRGPSAGKWNCLGGAIEQNESVEQNVVREVFEESGLSVTALTKHGLITIFSGNATLAKIYIFSTKNFEGDVKQSVEGELKWFDLNKIPYDNMWEDDRYWLPLVLKQKKFDCVFYYNQKMTEILRYEVNILTS